MRPRKPASKPPTIKTLRDAAIIAIGNHKGGVGKTTVTVNLAAALGELGHKVLLIDLDPSGGATHHLGVDPYAYQGAAELMGGKADPLQLVITEDMPDNVSLIAARPELADIQGQGGKLRESLDTALSTYDYILLDTPPNPKSPCTYAAYASADWFLFVTTPQALSIRGLGEALRDVGVMRRGPNPNLEVLGVIFNAVDTRSRALRNTHDFIKLHKTLRPFSRSGFIPNSVFPNRAAEQGRSLFQVPRYRYKTVTLCIEQIAREIADRCMNRESYLAQWSSSNQPTQSLAG